MKYKEEEKKHNFRPLAARPQSQTSIRTLALIQKSHEIKEDHFREPSDPKPVSIPMKARVTVL